MDTVKSCLKPWMDKDGNVRYYVNDIESLIYEYREYNDVELVSYYDYENMRASAGRVRQKIEHNILSKTKIYIDSDGHIIIYGYAIYGKGLDMELPKIIESAVNFKYGFCPENVREKNKKLIGQCGKYARIGDIVEIVKGRKSLGKTFIITKITKYCYSNYSDPSMYLYEDENFKVNAENCIIRDVGYSY